MDYYEHLGLEVEDVLLTSAEHIRSVVGNTSDAPDDLRHTGDCVDLLARAYQRQGMPAAMQYLHALKFYSAASA
jgi:hypothetical protein